MPQTGHIAIMLEINEVTPERVIAGIKLGRSFSRSTSLPRRQGAITDV
jgi:hypothetical protein